MVYETFKAKLVEKDARNEFGPELTDAALPVPNELRTFYQKVNPIDVEVVLPNFTSIKFFALSELETIQKEYQAGNDIFVFASQEGDPIAVKDGKVCLATHGSTSWEWDYLAGSVEEFLEWCMKLEQ